MSSNILRGAAVFFYCMIILMGEFLALPFIIWLLFTSFNFGNIEQLTAFAGLIGIVLTFSKFSKDVKIRVLSFLLMILPLIVRLLNTPIAEFNYFAFYIPLILFIIFYLLFISKKRAKR